MAFSLAPTMIILPAAHDVTDPVINHGREVAVTFGDSEVHNTIVENPAITVFR